MTVAAHRAEREVGPRTHVERTILMRLGMDMGLASPEAFTSAETA